MHDDAIQDIGVALNKLRQAFIKHKIPVPDELTWTDKRKRDEANLILHSEAP
jgi:hypothetical protein